jgi:drug/metabolite transporter (DMT)-like permease
MTGAGIVAALAAAVAYAFAVALQAAEARQMPDREAMHAALLRRLARRRRWLAGTLLMVVGGVLQVVALALAPIVIVQPMLATSQLVLLALARVKLGERVGRGEALGSLAIVLGLSAVVAVAPRHSIVHSGGRVVAPLLVVGTVALALFLLGRVHHRARLLIVIGAGVAYSWADFALKLLANEVSSQRWITGALWAVGVIAFGAIAFLEENTSLGQRPAVTVAPVIGAIKVPLPVLMALWTGVETWGPNAVQVGFLLVGLALVAGGAARLGRSETVARVSAGETVTWRGPLGGARAADAAGRPAGRARGTGRGPLAGREPLIKHGRQAGRGPHHKSS